MLLQWFYKYWISFSWQAYRNGKEPRVYPKATEMWVGHLYNDGHSTWKWVDKLQICTKTFYSLNKKVQMDKHTLDQALK